MTTQPNVQDSAIDPSWPLTGGRHVYGLKATYKMLYLIVGMVLLGVGIVVWPLLLHTSATGLAALMAPACGVGAAIYLFAMLARAELTLDGDRITVRGAFTEKSADRSEIEGLHMVRTRNGTYTQLLLRNGRGSISVHNIYDTDQAWREWLHKVPDLDQRDREKILSDIQQDAELGSSPEARLGALANAKTWAVFLAIVAGAALAAALFANDSVRLTAVLTLTLAPVVAIFLISRSPMLYAVFRQKADPRADMSFVIILSTIGLLVQAGGIHFLSITPMLYVATPVAMAFFGVCLMAINRGPSQPGAYIALLMFGGFYGWGFAVASDTLTDHGDTQRYAATVNGKHLSHGRSTSYYLHLAPWGPQAEPSQVSVGSRTYYKTEIGDEVCVYLHPGSIHVPWYRVSDCSGAPQ